jgi:hypothetical protein
MTSIWLRPEGCQEQALQAVIDGMATEFGTVSFSARPDGVRHPRPYGLRPAHLSLLYWRRIGLGDD